MAEVRVGRHVYFALLLASAAALASAPTFRRAIPVRPLKDIAAAVGSMLTKMSDAAEMTAAAEAGLDLQSVATAESAADTAPPSVEQAAAKTPASP